MPLDPVEIIGGLAIGEGLGGAIADTVTPRLQSFRNDQWAQHTDVPLNAAEAAAVAAENYASFVAMEAEAALTGYNTARFQHLYDVTLSAPGVGMLLELLRRSSEEPINFDHGLHKAKLEGEWFKAIRNLRYVRIPGPDLAYMVVRGVVPNAGTLPSDLPTHADKLELPPQLDINPIDEAALTGWDRERFSALVARSGLAMAPVMAAQAHFRGILTLNDYLLTIARGDLFPAFADPVLQVSRQIPTAHDFVQGHLRGWRTLQQMHDGAALHGMTAAHANLLYEIERRPLTPHTIAQALARGGVFQPAQDEIQDPYDAAVHQQNLGPEWYSLGKAMKYAPPSAFVIRALLRDGAYTVDHGEKRLLQLGLFPEDAKLIAEHYGAQTSAGADPHVSKAETQLWNTIHSSYKNGEIDAATATTALPHAGVAADAVAKIIAVWDVEKGLPRKTLTAAQIKKAYREGAINDATKQAWTKDEALAALVALGYSSTDANDYLNL